MKRLLVAFCAFFIATGALADGVFVAPAPPGQLPGTTTNDDASAGNVGQLIYASTAETNGGQTAQTATITIASPAVITWSQPNPFSFSGTGCAAVNFTTTGALPTGLTAGTQYYVGSSSISGNNFSVATSCANAIAGTYVNTSGTQSGTQTGVPTAILSTGNSVDTTGLQLTAGDWDVYGSIAINSAASTSFTSQGIVLNTTSNTLNTIPFTFNNLSMAAEVPAVANSFFIGGPLRIKVASGNTQNVFCMGRAVFTVSTASSWGACRARRIR